MKALPKNDRVAVSFSAAFLCAIALGSSLAQAGPIRPSVVYGTDDRQDLVDVTDSFTLELADSVVALINSSDLKKSGSNYTIRGLDYQDEYGLCSSEPFLNQPTGAFCSGALVGPDLVLTAAHCIETAKDCSSTRFVFGYSIRQPGDTARTVPANEVFKCKKIVNRFFSEAGADYALVQLTTKVKKHAPLELNRSGTTIAPGTPIGIIGHPNGLPAKAAFGAVVRESANDDFFVSNLDAYGSNSGSPVFNANTGLIEGILVRGEEDFVLQNGCQVSYRCTDDGCNGEEVVQILNVLDLVPEL